MKHILFPTVAAADAFIADLQSRGVVQPEVGTMNMNRRVQQAATAGTVATPTTTTTTTTTDYVEGGGTAEDAGAGAVKGTVAGALTGAAAGVLGTAATLGTAAAATVATGGLALPVILGMAALGSGVGAAVGAAGGAAGVDETGGAVRSSYDTYEADDAYYNRIHERVNAGGRAVAVDDNVPQDVLMEAVSKHGGEIVSA
ncbi:hypothetical protein [Deinococcus wulumuqiensis]|uniref:DUF1269 domain-containing protein n=2 Tax=Deinococcus wulumuqiensis TaxID=980427 RepID=A0AAV4K5W8_9DEIO|nr:hypothetical protein [Deinococcus wulumuqiensis]QII19553.1 hypothetical protein G6R31_01385 [Deinococcus wulumuqiensis R12]GGI88298.1 hypothetical protein GCM10010914_23380 [Deinococcus wulumuqiensis]GGP30345.1 hypothetical protein GCM10008021_19960 [Deinococcus wulumuqiensis]